MADFPVNFIKQFVSHFFWCLYQILLSKFLSYYCSHYILQRILHIISRKCWYSMQTNLWWWAIPKSRVYLILRFCSNHENSMLVKYTCFTVAINTEPQQWTRRQLFELCLLGRVRQLLRSSRRPCRSSVDVVASRALQHNIIHNKWASTSLHWQGRVNRITYWSQGVASLPHKFQPPSPPLDNIRVMMICLEVKREYYQNCSVLGCVTQCSLSAAHSCEQFLRVQQIEFVTLGPLRHA